MGICAATCSLLVLCIVSGTAAAQSRAAADRLLAWATVWGNVKGEGFYTCEEWKQYAAGLFKGADRNRDGYVDAQEFPAIQQADTMLKGADLAYFDDNRDGRLSRSEFVDKPNPFFAHFDRKRTCKVTLDDISDADNPAKLKPRSGQLR